jgi:hypothetical protein
MLRYLVVGNQTLGSEELREELRKRFEADPNSFFLVLVPNTHAVDYHGVPVAGGFVPMPTLITASGPATNEEATALAQHQLDQLLKRLRELGVKAEGQLLAQRVSKWLRTDLPKSAASLRGASDDHHRHLRHARAELRPDVAAPVRRTSAWA